MSPAVGPFGAASGEKGRMRSRLHSRALVSQAGTRRKSGLRRPDEEDPQETKPFSSCCVRQKVVKIKKGSGTNKR